MRPERIRVYDPRGKEVSLSVGQTAPAGWFHGGLCPVVLEREHVVLLAIIRGEDMDLDEDDPANVRRVVTFEPVWTKDELAAFAEKKRAADAAEAAKVAAKAAAMAVALAECQERNITATGGVWEVRSVSLRVTAEQRAAGTHYQFEERAVFIASSPTVADLGDGGDGGGSGYGRHSAHGGLESIADRGYNKSDVDWAFDARNPANAWND